MKNDTIAEESIETKFKKVMELLVTMHLLATIKSFQPIQGN
jgi:hypothetical protein